MKNSSLLLFFVFFRVFLNAQEVTKETQQISTAPYDHELSDKQFSAWKRISNSWLGSDFQMILAEYKVAMTCKSCSAFYMEIEIKVGANGKMEYYRFIDGKKCGTTITKPVELRIMRNFFKMEFPAELRNITFRTRLGEVLKC